MGELGFWTMEKYGKFPSGTEVAWIPVGNPGYFSLHYFNNNDLIGHQDLNSVTPVDELNSAINFKDLTKIETIPASLTEACSQFEALVPLVRDRLNTVCGASACSFTGDFDLSQEPALVNVQRHYF